MAEGAYARAGVDQLLSGNAVSALVGVLSGIRTGRPSRAALESGHYANVLEIGDGLGLALSCDSVGSKVIICEQLGRYDTIGIDLLGFCVGLVQLDAIVTGDRIESGDTLIGIPSSGIHSNGLSLARSVLTDLDEQVGGETAGDLLLEPTVIYVQAVRELLASGLAVRGLAHITGDGFLNLLRLEGDVGYSIDSPLPVPRVFELIAERGGVEDAELYEVFNMGCGFCVVVPHEDADAAVELLARHHPGTAVIGRTTTASGVVELPKQGLIGRRGEGFKPAS